MRIAHTAPVADRDAVIHRVVLNTKIWDGVGCVVDAFDARARNSVAEAAKGTRAVYFDAKNATKTTVYERDKLDVGVSVSGPAIVEQFDATTVIPAGWQGRVDRFGNLILEG